MEISRPAEGGHGDAVAYVLGALDEAARARFEAHAATCAECLREVEELRPVADRLGLAVQQVDPPDHLAGQILAQASALAPVLPRPDVVPPSPPAATRWTTIPPAPPAAPRRSWWQFGERASMAMAGASLVVALLGSGLALLERQEVRRAEARVLETASVAAQLTEMLSIMYEPGRTGKPLNGTEMSPGAKGMVYLVPDGAEAVVVAYNLPRLSGNECYQFWLNNPEEERRVSGGTFKVDERGRGHFIARSPAALSQFRTAGVTRERGKGSPYPSGPRVLAGNL